MSVWGVRVVCMRERERREERGRGRESRGRCSCLCRLKFLVLPFLIFKALQSLPDSYIIGGGAIDPCNYRTREEEESVETWRGGWLGKVSNSGKTGRMKTGERGRAKGVYWAEE